MIKETVIFETSYEKHVQVTNGNMTYTLRYVKVYCGDKEYWRIA